VEVIVAVAPTAGPTRKDTRENDPCAPRSGVGAIARPRIDPTNSLNLFPPPDAFTKITLG
jgi:hypothetical protein